MKSLFAHLRAFWRGARRPTELDRDMTDEMRFHIEMETERLQRRGLSPDEAARQAAISFGGVEKYRGAGRDALGLTWLRGLSTDMKLGTRMLRKHPGLTAVALFALSLAIGAGAAYLEFVNDLMHGKLPFADADRIVGIQMWDRRSGDPEHRVSADYVSWQSSLRSFEELAAFRRLDFTLTTPDGHAEPVEAAEMTPSAFHIARVAPLFGRPLIDDDARPGAPPVAVIGYDLWTLRFGSDPEVVGQVVRLGQQPYTIVGVMPQGFGLPVYHSIWVPLRVSDTTLRREGPPTRVFGKLAAGTSIRAAQAELDAIAARSAADFPATHQYLNPVVKLYVESLWSAVEDSTMQTTVFYGANVFFIGLLALCGANIATLVFARTATRETEISVRTALGASRARIAGQLFAEALVLSSLAAVIGLMFGVYALKWVKASVVAGMGEPMMFWWNDRLAPATMVYAALLAVFAAIIIGVVPALKATGAKVQDRLKQSTGATSSSLKFGGVWTGVIVTQVSVTVVFLAIVGILGWSAYVSGGGKRRQNFPADQYLTARVMLDRTAAQSAAVSPEQETADYERHFRTTFAELSRRLEAEPALAGVTYGKRLPGMNAEFLAMDVDGLPPQPGQNAFDIRMTSVATNYFETFGAPIISGRSFTAGDVIAGQRVAIVDRTFARRMFNGQDAVGRQVRRAGADGKEPGPWIEIVGVVADLTDETNKNAGEAMLYLPAAAESLRPFYLGVRARTTTAAAMSRLWLIANEVDPTLRLSEVMPLDQISEYDRVALDFFARLLGGVSIVAMVLAAAGVYALMSFTVSRRTAEIGIRVALGANPRRIVWSTFSRAFAKIAIGIVAGSVPAAAIAVGLGPEVSPSAGGTVTLVTCAFATLTVAMITALACVFPARRALRIHPTDALKSE
jgi:predicted permease